MVNTQSTCCERRMLSKLIFEGATATTSILGGRDIPLYSPNIYIYKDSLKLNYVFTHEDIFTYIYMCV